MSPSRPSPLARCAGAFLLIAGLLLPQASLASDATRFRVADETVGASEGSGTVTVVVRRDGDGPASVAYTTADGTALAGADYVAASGTLSWADGENDDRPVTIPVIDDADAEPSEFFSLVLSSPSTGVIDDDRAVITIAASDGGGGGDDGGGTDPSRIKFDQRSVLVSEGAGSVAVVVERSQGEDGSVSVEYFTTDGSAVAPDDYAATSGTLSWGAGDGSNRVITIPIVADGLAEGQESFLVRLTNVGGNGFLDTARSSLTVTVLDPGTGPGGGDDGGGDDGGGDDDAGVLKFDQRSFTTIEGNPQAIVTVERSKGEGGSVSVRYAASMGTADAPADFATTEGILEWPPGDGGVRSFTIDIVDDAEAEPGETVFLELFSPTGGAAIDPVRGEAVLTILDNDGGAGGAGGGDDDGPGLFKFSERGGFQVLENGGTALVGVERSRGGAGAVSVRVETFDGSAIAGLDYATTVRTLSWGPRDESTRFVEVPVFDDLEGEGNETVQLRLVAPAGGAGLDPERSETTLTILDDDGATATCLPSSTTLCLQQGRFSVDVVWRTRQGTTGRGEGRNLSDSSGVLWFFSEDNVEILIKTLDACGIPDFESFWVFYAATTDVDFTLRVTDTETGVTREYGNLLGQAAAPVQDLSTFRTCNG